MQPRLLWLLTTPEAGAGGSCSLLPAGVAQGGPLGRPFVLRAGDLQKPSIFQCVWLSSQTLCAWRASGVFYPGLVGPSAKEIFDANKEFLLDALNSTPGRELS